MGLQCLYDKCKACGYHVTCHMTRYKPLFPRGSSPELYTGWGPSQTSGMDRLARKPLRQNADRSNMATHCTLKCVRLPLPPKHPALLRECVYPLRSSCESELCSLDASSGGWPQTPLLPSHLVRHTSHHSKLCDQTHESCDQTHKSCDQTHKSRDQARVTWSNTQVMWLILTLRRGSQG